MSEISLVYEAIGRLVVAFVSRRYRGEVRLASTAVALGLIAAILCVAPALALPVRCITMCLVL